MHWLKRRNRRKGNAWQGGPQSGHGNLQRSVNVMALTDALARATGSRNWVMVAVATVFDEKL